MHMASPSLVTTAVLLLLCWSIHQTKAQGIDISSPSQPLTAGERATFTCTSLLGPADMIQWFLVDGASETLQVMNTGQAALDLVLDPVSESTGGRVYRCRVTMGGGPVDRDVTLSVQVTEMTILAFNTTSSLRYPPLQNATLETTIVLSFNPASPQGLLLYSGDGTRFKDFISLSLVDQRVEFRYDLGLGTAIIISDIITLNTWHTVTAYRNLMAGSLQIDNGPIVRDTSPGGAFSLDPGGDLYLGGVTDLSIVSIFAGTELGFTGCVQLLQVGVGDNLIGSEISGRGITQCTNHPCIPDPCANGGICQATGDTFACLCALGFNGPTCSEIDPLTANIVVTRTEVPGFTPEDPTQFRAASGRHTFTCTSSGGSGVGPTYQWSSTCDGCPFDGARTAAVIQAAVAFFDTGTHTCEVTRGMETVTTNTTINVVGAGIHDVGSIPFTSLPNNDLVVFSNPGNGFRLHLFCRSDSMMDNVGELIGLNGNVITSNNFFDINNPQPGEVTVENTVGSQDALTTSVQGVYACRIPLQNGAVRDINIGIYPSGFNTGPMVNDPLMFTPRSPPTLTCTSTGSPATTVTFTRDNTTIGPLRDGESVTVGGIFYQLAQTVTNRQESTYENVLTINEQLDSLVGSSFTCGVENALGTDTSQPIRIQSIEFASSPTTVSVGDTVTYTCTSVLGTATIEWLDTANGNAVLITLSGVTELDLVLNRISQSMDGRVYTCRVTVEGSPTTRDLTVAIEAPSMTATIDVAGLPVVGADITLTCSVNGLNNLASDTTIEFRGPREATDSGSTSLQLSLNPAQFSDDGQYMCITTVSSSLLNSDVTVTDTQTLDLQISNPQVGITHNGGTPLYAGSVLTLTCMITVVGVSTDMLNNVEVTRTWIMPGGNILTNGSIITVSPVALDSGTTYTSTAAFNTLVTNNMGDYTCQANIGSSVSSIQGSETVVAVIRLDIQLPTLILSVVSSTTRLPDVFPYNTLNLTCTATAPEGVISPKAFMWHRADAAAGSCTDFPVISDNVIDSNLNQPVSTSILNVTETVIGTLYFFCEAIITDLGVGGTSNDVRSIQVIGPAPPMQPINVRVIRTDPTTATVEWTVPLIAYTPETYVVSYSTSTAKRQTLMSVPVESGADFDAVNQMFSVELTGLEPSTAYNYQVLSENSVDSSTSTLQSFTTTAVTSSDSNVVIIGGVLGGSVVLLLVYSVITTIVIVRLRRDLHAGLSIHRHGMERPVKLSTVTKIEDSDLVINKCAAYGKAQQPPPNDRAQDSTYAVIGEYQ